MSDHTKTLNRACLLSLYFLFFCSCTTHSKLQPTQNFQELSKPAIEVSDSCQSAAESYLVNRRCHSQLLSIEPGHYQFTLALRGINLENRISENFLITIEQYDNLGNKIPVEVNYLKNTLAGRSLDGALVSPTKGSAFSGQDFTTLTLIHRPYPADSGWFPEATLAEQGQNE